MLIYINKRLVIEFSADENSLEKEIEANSLNYKLAAEKASEFETGNCATLEVKLLIISSMTSQLEQPLELSTELNLSFQFSESSLRFAKILILGWENFEKSLEKFFCLRSEFMLSKWL